MTDKSIKTFASVFLKLIACVLWYFHWKERNLWTCVFTTLLLYEEYLHPNNTCFFFKKMVFYSTHHLNWLEVKIKKWFVYNKDRFVYRDVYRSVYRFVYRFVIEMVVLKEFELLVNIESISFQTKVEHVGLW